MPREIRQDTGLPLADYQIKRVQKAALPQSIRE